MGRGLQEEVYVLLERIADELGVRNPRLEAVTGKSTFTAAPTLPLRVVREVEVEAAAPVAAAAVAAAAVVGWPAGLPTNLELRLDELRPLYTSHEVHYPLPPPQYPPSPRVVASVHALSPNILTCVSPLSRPFSPTFQGGERSGDFARQGGLEGTQSLDVLLDDADVSQGFAAATELYDGSD